MSISNKHHSSASGVNSIMTNRFDDTEIKDTDVILTTKTCD